MKKICVTTSSRADFSRVETILRELKKRFPKDFHLLVLGSHLLGIAGNTKAEIENKGFTVDHALYMEVAGNNPETMSKSVGLAIVQASTLFDRLKPDIVLVHGDRFESLAIGITAALMNIHVAHVQGGEVTGSIDESIRHALTKLSHLHFVATEKSRERVIKMGEDPTAVFNIGCPGTDLLINAPALTRNKTIDRLNKEVIKTAQKLDRRTPYILMVQHPVTTEFEDARRQIIESIEAVSVFNEQILILWPNIDAGADEISKILRTHPLLQKKRVGVFKHIPSEIFVNVLRNAACFIGNSSSGIRESCYFGTPTINIGSRQNTRERGSNVVDVGYDRKEIARAIKKQIAHGKYPVEHIYGNGTAGKQFADICATINLPNIQKRIAY